MTTHLSKKQKIYLCVYHNIISHKMKRILLFTLALLPIMVSCEKDKIEEEEKVTIKLNVTNLTEDGYFDGLLYYKVTSNSPCEVCVNKADKTATIVEIPSRIEINGNVYTCTSIADKAFYECRSLSSIIIPKTIKSIGARAFEGCYALKIVTIPESVTSIDFCAFYGCSGLTSITIPKGVTRIEASTFCDCSELTSIIIPEGVTRIEQDAFFYCSRLTTITIPESVSTIGGFVFGGCSGLKTVVCKRRTPPTCDVNVFIKEIEDVHGYTQYVPYTQSVTLYVPTGSKEAYQNSEPWNGFKEIIEEEL